MSENKYPDVFTHRRIREHILTFLKEDIPSRIERAMKAAGYSDSDEHPYLKLPILLPATWDEYDPTEVLDDDFPAIGLYLRGENNIERTDIDPSGGSEFESVWSCILSIACTNRYLGLDADGVDSYETPGRRAAIDNCQDLTQIVKHAIIDSPSFNFDKRSSEESMQLVDRSLSVSFSDPMKPNGNKSPVWVAVSQINFQIRTSETIERPYLGIAKTIITEVKVVEE